MFGSTIWKINFGAASGTANTFHKGSDILALLDITKFFFLEDSNKKMIDCSQQTIFGVFNSNAERIASKATTKATTPHSTTPALFATKKEITFYFIPNPFPASISKTSDKTYNFLTLPSVYSSITPFLQEPQKSRSTSTSTQTDYTSSK